MTKLNNDHKHIQQTVALGQKNKSLLPRAKNWCKHINIEDISSGLIAEMHNVPTNLRISCPHSNCRQKAMNFEWIAKEFILGNCRSCKFHEQIHEDNFGSDIIREYQEQQEKLRKNQEEEQQKKEKLKAEINDLVAREKSQGEITTLSILSIIRSLDEEKDENLSAKKILEASKLSPEFFSDVALDSLSLFFTNEEFGEEMLLAVEHILQVGKLLSDFAFERLISAIEKDCNLDSAIGVLRIYLKDKNIGNLSCLIDIIIGLLEYERQLGQPYDSRPSYPNFVMLAKEIYDKDKSYLIEHIQKHLEIDNKVKRININYLLQELTSTAPEVTVSFVGVLINSLEFADDDYGESADHITCTTLSKIYSCFPEVVS